jgi:hypothetical protein
MSKKLIFFDTNILREIITHKEKWHPFSQYLENENLVIVISAIQFIELYKVKRYHDVVTSFLLEIPSCMFRWWTEILKDEVEAFPHTLKIQYLTFPSFQEMFSRTNQGDKLRSVLDDPKIGFMWEAMEVEKLQFLPIMKLVTKTLPKNQDFINQDFELHNFGRVLSDLRKVSRSFIDEVKDDLETSDLEYFTGSFLRASYLYYKYILRGAKLKPSDLGDYYQTFYIPYCSIAVVEKDMARILHLLKKGKNLLPNTEVKSIRFIRRI